MSRSEQKALMSLQDQRQQRSMEIAEKYRPQIERLDETVSIWGKAKWASVDKLAPADLKAVATAVLRSFPDFGALEVTNYFDIMGGKLRPNAEFWLHMATNHPEYDGHEMVRLVHGTAEWDEWINVEDPNVIAAAVRFTVRRKDRSHPFIEASYVRKSDDILYEFSWQPLPDAKNLKEAQQAAPTDTVRLKLMDDYDTNQKMWKAQTKVLREDWEGLALKKARTTAARRACRMAFSLSEAKVISLQGKVEVILASKDTRMSNDPKYAPAAPVHPNERTKETVVLPEEDEPVVQRPAEAADLGGEVVDEPPAAEPAPKAAAATPEAEKDLDVVSEADRRRMFTWLNDRELGERTAHEVLKQLIAEVQKVPVDQVSTKQVRYKEYEEIRRRVEALPVKAGA